MAYESFAQQFTTLGGRRVFGVPGGGPSLELITQIENAGGAFTATGHEAVAALMAGAHARQTGKPAACITIKGPGFMNLAPGLLCNSYEGYPCLSISEAYPPNEASGRRHKWLNHLDVAANFLRGIGFNESSLGVYPAVSVYVDQVPLSFPVLASHSAYDLERIEVLKGPQGTLFGQNSTGGAINYIAAKPTKTFEAGGDMSFGRFNAIEGNGYISGPLSDSVRARLAVTGKNADGWQYSYTQPNEKNGKESYVAGRLTVDVDATDKIKLSFSANGWKDKSDPQAQQLIAIHEQIGAGATGAEHHALDATPLIDPVRNGYSVPPAGCADAELCYPFSPFNSRAADWGVQLVDPNTSPANAGGASDPAKAGKSARPLYGSPSIVSIRPDIRLMPTRCNGIASGDTGASVAALGTATGRRVISA